MMTNDDQGPLTSSTTVVWSEDPSNPFHSPVAELQIVKTVLNGQIRLNDQLSEANLSLSQRNSRLEALNSALKTRLSLAESLSLTEKAGRFNDPTEADLEEEMLRAQLNASALKGIVTPLEEEVASLRLRLSQAESCLQHSILGSTNTFPEVSPDAISFGWNETEGDAKHFIPFKADLDKSRACDPGWNAQSRIEDSQRCIISLLKQIDSFSNTSSNRGWKGDVLKQLESEKAAHHELKETWRKANENFLQQSNNLHGEILHLREQVSTLSLCSNPGDGGSGGADLSDRDRKSKSYSERALHRTSHVVTSIESSSQEMLGLKLEVIQLKEELERQTSKMHDMEMGVGLLVLDADEQLKKVELDIAHLDTIMGILQEEVLRVQGHKSANQPKSSACLLDQNPFDSPPPPSPPLSSSKPSLERSNITDKYASPDEEDINLLQM